MKHSFSAHSRRKPIFSNKYQFWRLACKTYRNPERQVFEKQVVRLSSTQEYFIQIEPIQIERLGSAARFARVWMV